MGHVQNTLHQYNLSSLGSSLKYKYTRENTNDIFADTSVQRAIDLDSKLIGFYKRESEAVEKFVERTANIMITIDSSPV